MLIQIVTDKCVIKIRYFVIYVYQKLLPIVIKKLQSVTIFVRDCNKIWTNRGILDSQDVCEWTWMLVT